MGSPQKEYLFSLSMDKKNEPKNTLGQASRMQDSISVLFSEYF